MYRTEMAREKHKPAIKIQERPFSGLARKTLWAALRLNGFEARQLKMAFGPFIVGQDRIQGLLEF